MIKLRVAIFYVCLTPLAFWQGASFAQEKQTTSEIRALTDELQDKINSGDTSELEKKPESNQIIISNSNNSTSAEAISRYDDGEELIFSLIIEKFILGEVFVVFQSGQFYYHLGDFVSAVDFPIIRDAASIRPSYKGWWARPDNTFELSISPLNNSNAGSVLSGSKRLELGANDYTELYGDIFISESALSEWFNAKFTYNITKQRVTIETSEMWPIQQEQNRKNSKLASRRVREDAKQPLYDPGYQMLSPQMLDFIGSVAQVGIGEDSERTTFTYGMVGRNDLLNWSARYYLGGTDIDLTSQAFVDFTKHWSDPQTAPLGISTVQFGDIQPIRIAGRSFGNTRGVSVSNKALNQELDQESTNISGYVQKGWDVELHQNGVLISQELNVASGRYEFLDVLLFAGENNFEVKKYGPQGQILVENIQRFSQLVSRELFDPSYEVSLVENNKSIFDLDLDNDRESYVTLDGRYSMAVLEGLNVNLQHSIVISEDTSDALPSPDDDPTNDDETPIFDPVNQSNVVGVGLSFRPLQNVAVTSTFNHIEDRFNNLNTSVFTNIANQNIVFTSDLYESVNRGDNESRFARLSLRAIGNVVNIGESKLRHKTEYLFQSNANKTQSHVFQNSLSANFGRVSVNNNLLLRRDEQIDSDNDAELFSGTLGMSTSIGNVFSRAGVNYDFTNGFEVFSSFANFDYNLNPLISLSAELTKSFQEDFTRVALGLDWKHELYTINTTLDYNTLRGTSLFVSGRVSVGEAPTEFGYINNRFSLTTTGTVLVRAFHDVNNNLIYDADDIPIQGAKLRALQGNRSAETDVIGIAQFDNLSSFEQTDIVVDKTTLENPFLVQSTQLVSISPRAGLLTLINYPFVEGSEIEGEVTYVDEFGEVKYARNLPLVLIDKHGDIQHRFKTGFDGYFYVPGIIPHEYTLEIDPIAKAGAFRLPEAIEIDLKRQAQVKSDVNFQVIAKEIKTGYFVHSGEFASSQMLELFYQTLMPSIRSLDVNISPFQHKLGDGKLALGITFTEQRNDAEQVCNALSASLQNCVIEAHRYFVEIDE